MVIFLPMLDSAMVVASVSRYLLGPLLRNSLRAVNYLV
jgi:hypothetical protein